MSISDMIHNSLTMSTEEHADLLHRGWRAEVVDSLQARGFREAGVDPDDRSTPMFLKQSALPHLFIPVNPGDTLQDIDQAIYHSARRAGHESLASAFMRFFDSCKNWHTPDPLEKRLTALESQIINHQS